MLLVILGFILIFVHAVQSSFYASPHKNRVKKSTGDSIPWIGLLRVKHYTQKSEVVAGVVLIAHDFAIGNANDIDHIDKRTIRNTTRVTFFIDDNLAWDIFVKDYFLHPEFDEETTNTLALLQLDTANNIPPNWHPIEWSEDFYSPDEVENIFIVGFTDRRKIIEKIVKSMYPLDKESCKNFYVEQELDYKKMWPTHVCCFIDINTRDTCVYDAGMAIASNNSGYWTLIGLSTNGPGCSLPSRFIEFFPYVTWLRDIILRSQKPQTKYTRRFGEDTDTLLLAKLYENTVELFTNKANIEMEDFGNCSKKKYSLIYAEEGSFNLKYLFRPNTVFYSVSLWDARFKRVACMKSEVKCQKKSKTEITVYRGFGQEHLEPLIRYDAQPFANGSMPDKILFLKGNYGLIDKEIVTQIWFKFQMYQSAKIRVQFFGTYKNPPATNKQTPGNKATTAEQPTTAKPRPPHATYQGSGVYHG